MKGVHLSTRFTVAVIAALAACLATGCSSSSGRVLPVVTRRRCARCLAGRSPGADPASVPGHYVTLDDAHPSRLLVRGTVTGAVTATVSAPARFLFDAVYGTGTGRVFIIDGYPNPPVLGGGDHLYLLRLDSGASRSRWCRCPRGTRWGLACRRWRCPLTPARSPSPTWCFTSPLAQQPLILYSVKTGAVLRTWTTASGIISGTGPMGGSGAGPGTALRWTADGKELAFAFYANARPGKNGYGYQQSGVHPAPEHHRAREQPARRQQGAHRPRPRLHSRIRHRDAVPGAGRVEHLRQRRGPQRKKFISSGQRRHAREQDVLDVIELEHQCFQRLQPIDETHRHLK